MSHIDEAEVIIVTLPEVTPVYEALCSNEVEWINKVAEHSNGNIALIAWNPKEVKGNMLLTL